MTFHDLTRWSFEVNGLIRKLKSIQLLDRTMNSLQFFTIKVV